MLGPAFALPGPELKPGQTASEPALEAAAQVQDAGKPAGLIEAMRNVFRKIRVRRLSFAGRPKIRIEDHWPHCGLARYT